MNIYLFFILVVSFMYGACLGSFTTALLWRVPKRLPWAFDKGEAVRSQCPSCGHMLHARDLWPLFSWALQGGRCHYCKGAISARYPLIELGCGLFALLCVCLFGISMDIYVVLSILPFLITFLVSGLLYKVWAKNMAVVLVALIVTFALFSL